MLSQAKFMLKGTGESGWDTVSLGTCKFVCHRKRVVSPDIYKVNSKTSSDKDCRAQRFDFPNCMEKRQGKQDKTGNLASWRAILSINFLRRLRSK